MTELTEQRIAEITAREQATTPGPWMREDAPDYAEIHVPGGKAQGDVPIALVEADYNAAFIAHARQDIPDLLAALADKEAEIKRLREAQAWISVSDRLPDGRRSVLVYCPKYVNIYCASIHEDGTWWHFAQGNYQVYEEVTHWITLPQPPEATP